MTASVLVTGKWHLQQSLLACASALVFISKRRTRFQFHIKIFLLQDKSLLSYDLTKNLVYYRAILYMQLCMYFANEPVNEKVSEIQ